MIPARITDQHHKDFPCFSWGDQVCDLIAAFEKSCGRPFFEAYMAAIRTNQRVDGRKDAPTSLVVFEDDQVILFVPKAQISEWELQIMAKKPCGHVVAADTSLRNALDQALLMAIQTLEKLGAQMVTGVEFSSRFDRPDSGMHLLYSLIPRLPYAPATFSEAQLRWITGCYPEDVAQACRDQLDSTRIP
jgi:hypothetical protein